MIKAIQKLISAVINLRMAESIFFCDAVHGFRRHRGCFTVIGEANLRMQKAACKGAMFFQIYFDLRNAYNSIHCDAVLALLHWYGIGPCI